MRGPLHCLGSKMRMRECFRDPEEGMHEHERMKSIRATAAQMRPDLAQQWPNGGPPICRSRPKAVGVRHRKPKAPDLRRSGPKAARSLPQWPWGGRKMAHSGPEAGLILGNITPKEATLMRG